MTIPTSNPKIVDGQLPKDQLGSIQRQLTVHVLCEGEIEGFPSASGTRGSSEYETSSKKDIFLNGTPILQQTAPVNPSPNNFNFQNVFTEARFGTSDQTRIQGFTDTETEFQVNVPLTQNVDITRTVNNNVDRIRITLRADILQNFTDEGDINGSSVRHTVKITQNNGTVSTPIDDTITGKSPNAYLRDYIINIPANFSYPLTITVRRLTADSTNQNRNTSRWVQYTEIQDEADAFPDTAHVAVRVDAETFPQSPNVMFRIRGKKIRIPHNATVRSDGSLSFSGIFDGTFLKNQDNTDKRVYCNDPAWVLYDLLTNERFGFGDHITDSMLDKFAFYSASVYNSELILDNEGRNPAPRFSCNAVIQNQVDSFNLINQLCSTMRATAFYSAGSITLSQDRPTDPSYFFTLANVTEEGFSYTNSSKSIKYTVVNVQFFDMQNQEFDYETVESTIYSKEKYGFVVKNIKAFAITSRTQAQRLGKWFLYTQAQEGEVITFKTTIEAGSLVRVGNVIKVADPVRSGVRRGGRIKSATLNTITVDDASSATDLDSTNEPFLSVIMPDGSVQKKQVIGEISNGIITVDSNFKNNLNVDTVPNTNSMWVLENNTKQTQLFRVISVVEQERFVYQITGVFHDPNKYAFVENDDPLEERSITTLTELAKPPSNLFAEERIVVINNRAVSKISLTWKQEIGVNEYQVQYRYENGNFINTNVTRTSFDILNTNAGLYEFRVFSLNARRRPSNLPAEFQLNAVGKTAKPQNVQNLRIEPVNEKLIRLRWDQSTEVDVTHGGFCRIRHSPKVDGSGTFQNATDIDKLSGNSTQVVVPYVEGEYLIRFEDDTGNLSAASSSVIIDLPDTLGSLLVQTRREENDTPKFQGDKTNIVRDDSLNCLKLSDPSTNSTGEYEFKDILDLEGVFSIDLKRHLFTEGYYPDDLFDSRTALIDTWDDFDGSEANNTNAEILVATTTSAPSGSNYADSDFIGKPFNTFVNGTYKARALKFKLKISTTDVAQNIQVKELGYTATFQRRTEFKTNVRTVDNNNNAAAKDIVFDKPFFVGTPTLLGADSNLPSIGITATDNITSGDFFQVTNISSTGFTVTFKNSSNTVIDRNFNFSVVGFGKGA